MPLDQTHQHSSADVMKADDPHTPINPDGGSTPTLAEVLAAGNETFDAAIVGGDGVDVRGGSLIVNQGDSDGTVTIQAGTGNTSGGLHTGGGAQLIAGDNGDPNNPDFYGPAVLLDGATPSAHGTSRFFLDGTFGSTGQVPAHDAAGFVTWTSLLSSGSGAPGSSFTTFLYLDTDTTPGALYAWNGSGYTQVSAG